MSVFSIYLICKVSLNVDSMDLSIVNTHSIAILICCKLASLALAFDQFRFHKALCDKRCLALFSIFFLRYGISGGEFAIGNVVCTGEEAHVLRCHYTLQPSCLPYQNIGVMCCEWSSPVYDTFEH